MIEAKPRIDILSNIPRQQEIFKSTILWTAPIIFLIIVQVTNVLGSWAYVYFGERFGYKNSLVQSLILIAIGAMIFITSVNGFFNCWSRCDGAGCAWAG